MFFVWHLLMFQFEIFNKTRLRSSSPLVRCDESVYQFCQILAMYDHVSEGGRTYIGHAPRGEGEVLKCVHSK